MAIARDAFVHVSARDILAVMVLAGAVGGLGAGQAGVMMAASLSSLLAIAGSTVGGKLALPVVVRLGGRTP